MSATTWTPIGNAYVYSAHNGDPVPVGQLQLQGRGFAFQYANSWLARPDAFAVDPLNLKLSDKIQTATRMWCAFQDATPDNWGKRVLLATRSQQPQNEIEWLLASRGAGAGCLMFSAARSKPPILNPPPSYDQLTLLLEAADQVDMGKNELPPELAKLIGYGSSMGGARPKVTVVRDGVEWIAKLSRRDDVFNQPRAEFATLQMARAAGIDTVDHELVEIAGKAVLLVKRFDRIDGARKHYLSALSLINESRVKVGDPDGPFSYLRITDVIRRTGEDARGDARQLFGRMALNVLSGNTDDHLRNHGFLKVSQTTYKLSPVFDVLPHPGEVSLQALVIGRDGRAASIPNLLSSCERFGVDRDQAIGLIKDIQDVLDQSPRFYANAGMNAPEVRALSAVCTRLQGEIPSASPIRGHRQ